LRVRRIVIVLFLIVIVEAASVLLDTRYGDRIIPISYLYVLPVLLGGLYLGYAGGIGVPVFSIALYRLEQTALAHRTYGEADFLLLAILVIVGLMTARVQADRRHLRRYSLELERLGRAREELTALIVHDLRTPLAGLTMVLRLIAEQKQLALPQAYSQLVEVALATGEDMAGMIGDLLHLHAMESGALELHHGQVGAAEVVQAAVGQVEPLARQRRVRIEVGVEEGLPRLPADEVMLRRVLVNLLGNALRFSPDDGTVRVGAQRSGADLLFSVADEGPGIPEPLRERIFEKFARADEEVGKHVSSGLGLAFAKMAVEAHGGRIWVESPAPPAEDGKPAGGSRFAFSLPLIRSPGVAPP